MIRYRLALVALTLLLGLAGATATAGPAQAGPVAAPIASGVQPADCTWLS
jgi:hypothetical protein